MPELSIKVTIADRQYPLKIQGKDEENVRKAARKVNERLKEYEVKFAVADRKDALAMIALEFSADLIAELEKGPGLDTEDRSLIESVEQKLDHILKSTLS